MEKLKVSLEDAKELREMSARLTRHRNHYAHTLSEGPESGVLHFLRSLEEGAALLRAAAAKHGDR
jgi:hypothetical protein